MRRILLLLTLWLSVLCGFSQQSQIDSLGRILARTSSPEKRVDMLNDLSGMSFHYDVKKSFEYSIDAEREARACGYVDGIRASLIFQALALSEKGSYNEALKKCRAAYALAKDDELKAYSEVVIGNIFQSVASYDSSEFYYRRAIDQALRSKSDRYLAYAYKNLGRLYGIQWRNTEAENYFNKALEIYRRRNNRPSVAETLYALSDIRKNLGQFAAAHELIEEGCALTQDLTDDDLVTLYCAIHQGEIHFEMADYPESLRNYFLGLTLLEHVEAPIGKIRILRGLGDVYEALGQNDVAARYYLESLKIAEAIGVKYEIANVQAGVYYIYKNQKNFNTAHNYIDSSIRLRIEIGDKNGLGHSYNGKGVVYFDQQKYDSALIYFDKALKNFNEVGNRMGLSKSTFNKGRVMQALGQYNKAIEYYKTVLPIEEEIQNNYHLGVAYNAIGDLYLKMKDYRQASSYLTRGERMAEATTSKTLLMNNSMSWYNFYKAQGKSAQALTYHEKYEVYHDSIYSEMSAGKLAELEALYQLEKKDQQITVLNQAQQLKDNEIRLQQSRLNLQTILLISIIVILVLVSVFALVSNRLNKRLQKAHREITEQKEEIQAQSEELIEANETIANINKDLEHKIDQRTAALTQAYKELDTFFYRSSHDFRRPLTTFLGLAEVATVTVKDPNALELFEKVRETATNLDKMLIKLQSISDVGSQQMVYKEVLLKEIFDTVCNDFRDEIQRRGIKTSSEIRLENPFVSYPAMVKMIIENVVENAIHFAGNNSPFIRLRAYTSGQYVTIDVQDNGHGIAREYHEQIFEMYFRGSERSKGNGLGLYIVRKAIDKLEGTITVSSIVGGGTTFTIMLPNRLA